jgi:uncharacterized protein
MQTPWGDVGVSDAHVHFFSAGFFRLLGAAGRLHEIGFDPPPEDPAALARLWAAELDRHGVANAALLSSIPGDEASVLAALEACPGRFYGWFFLNPTLPDAVRRAEEMFAAGMRCACLFPAMHAYSVADPRVEGVLSAAARSRAAVFVHCGVLSVGVRRRLGLPSPFDLRFSNPIDLHPVALRHPGISFIVPHFGAGYFRETLMLAGLCPNVHIDTSSSNSWTRYLTPPPSLQQVFDRALDVAGPRRLLFGTDSSFFPRGWQQAVFHSQCEALSALGVSADSAALILGGNLRRLMDAAE